MVDLALGVGSSTIVVSQRGAVGNGLSGLGCWKLHNCRLPEGCCWEWLIWPWVLETPQLSSPRGVLLGMVDLALGVGNSTTVVSQRGAVGNGGSGLGCWKLHNCRLPEGCCWEWLILP